MEPGENFYRLGCTLLNPNVVDVPNWVALLNISATIML